MFAGGLQNSNHVCFMKPLFLSLFMTLPFSLGVIASVRDLYTVTWHYRCSHLYL